MPIHHVTNSRIHQFGALGDIHGAFGAARAIVARHPDIPFWLCVGDIADDQGRYASIGASVYWVHGNNDNFDAIAAGELPADLHHIQNGTAVDIGEAGPERSGLHQRPGLHQRSGFHLRVAGLGGTFAPTWYESAPVDLPHPKKSSAKATELADKRRHFVREQVDACKRLSEVDIFLTHEAARPFRPYPGNRGPDAGKVQVNEILAVMKPRLHLFGHHHRFSDEVREGARSVGLDLVTRSYLLIDGRTLDISLQSL